MARDFTVLDKRIVASDDVGNEMAWLLYRYDDDNSVEWKPQVTYENGKIDNPVWLPLPGSQYTFLECPIYEALYAGTRGPGKALINKDKLLTDSGWKEVGNVRLQDKLVAPDGTYTRIKGIYPQPVRPMYEMTFDDGATIRCDGDHRWLAYDSKRCHWRVKTTNELRTLKNYTHIPLIDNPVPGKKWEGYDPYIIGLMIGDGTMKAANPIIYNPEEEIKEYLVKHGWRCYDYEYRSVYQLALLGGDAAKRRIGAPIVKGDKKYVPEALLMADPEARLAVLQGLMDSDGHCDKEGRCEFKSVSEQLAKDVQYLARSLGGKARVHRQEIDPDASRFGNRDHIFRVKITHAGKFAMFRLPRHIERLNMKQHGRRRRIVSIEQVEDGPATCFEVEHPSHLFVCQDFIVTHNTLTLIMDFAKEIGKGYGKAWRGILFRQKLGDLDDVVMKIEEWMPKLYPGFRFRKSKADYSAVWTTGEELLLRHMEDERTYGEYHGHEYPWIGWEELTQWPNDKAYRMMMSCSRPPRPGVPTRIRATTNPFGCVPYGDVLTANRGWVPIQDIEEDELVLSVDSCGNIVEKPAKPVTEQYIGDMVSRKGRGLYMEFTEDHRLPLLNTAKDAFELRHFYELPGQAIIKRTGDNWTGVSSKWFHVPKIKTRKRKHSQPSKLTQVQYASLLGWFLSEGCCVDRDKAVSIAQSKPRGRAALKHLLDECGFKQSWTNQSVVLYAPDWWAYFKQFGKAPEKFIPKEVLRAETPVLRAFFMAAMAGDGHWHGEDSGTYYTISKRLADGVSEIGVKLGYSVFTSSRLRQNRNHRCYEISVSHRDNIQLNTGNHIYDVNSESKNVNVSKVQFNGEVYCLTVPETETFFIRQKGFVWLSGNSGHNWVRRRFELPQMQGRVIRNPGERARVAIHGNLAENFILLTQDPQYPINVREAASSPAQAQAWLDGRWDITAGGMIDDVFDRDYHVLPEILTSMIPHGWTITRSYDHGQSSPFSAQWFLESNGEAIVIDDRLIGNVRGDIILWQEWYGNDRGPRNEVNKGINLASRKIGAGIRDREIEWGVTSPSGFRSRVRPGPADTEIFNKLSDRHGRCPADDMEDEGIEWERADKSSGSRKRGWMMLRSYLQDAIPNPDGTREHPGFFVCENCFWWLELCPPMPRDDKDLDEVPDSYEDHAADSTRYRLNWTLPGMDQRSF